MILRWWILFSMSYCIIECINVHNLSRKAFRDSCPCLPKDICPSILGSSDGDIDFFGKISTCPDEDLVKCCSASSNYIVTQRDPNISHNNAIEASLATTTDSVLNSNEIENKYLEISSTDKRYSTTMTPMYKYEEQTEWKTTEYAITTEANKINITENIPNLEYSTLLSSNIEESITELYEYPITSTTKDDTISLSNIRNINETQKSTTEILIETTTEIDDVTTSTTSMPKTTSFHDRRIRLREFLKKRLKIPITTTRRPFKTIQNIIEKGSSYTSMTSNKETNMRSVLYTNNRPRESFLKKKQQNNTSIKSNSVKTSMINSDIQQTSPKIITSIPTEWSEISTPPTDINTHPTEIQNKIRKHFRGKKKYVIPIEW